MAFLLEEERPSSTATAYVKNSTPHALRCKLLSRIPVLVLSKIVLRQRLTRIYETIVPLPHLDQSSALEEIIQLITLTVLAVLQQFSVTSLTTTRTRILTLNY